MKQIGKGRETSVHPWRPLFWMPILTIGFCLAASKMILWGKLPESSVSYIPNIIGGTISLWGSYRGARIASRKKFIWGVLNAIAYGCILMLGNLLFFGEVFSGIGEMFFWIIGGGILGSFIAGLKKSKIA